MPPYFYLGMQLQNIEDGFRWINGGPIKDGFTAWLPGEPKSGGQRNCATLQFRASNSKQFKTSTAAPRKFAFANDVFLKANPKEMFGWASSTCSMNGRFICQSAIRKNLNLK